MFSRPKEAILFQQNNNSTDNENRAIGPIFCWNIRKEYCRCIEERIFLHRLVLKP